MLIKREKIRKKNMKPNDFGFGFGTTRICCP